MGELREQTLQTEISECTFKPISSTSKIRAVTPDRARRLFERHLSWKQRLNDENDKQRKEKREANEREIRLLRRSASADAPRRSASADAAFRLRGACQHATGNRCSEDVDTVFKQLYQRNRQWQRERDA